MSKRSFRAALVVFAVTVVTLVVVALWVYGYAKAYPDRPLQKPGRSVKLVIPHGSNFSKVLGLLEQHNVVPSPLAFRIFANVKGKASKIRAGKYTIDTSWTPAKLLEILVKGVPAPSVKVTIPPGKTMLEVAQILADKKIVTSAAALIKLMYDRPFLRRLGVPSKTIEGFLFPDTYKLKAPTHPKEVLRRLFLAHRRVYYALAAKYSGALKRLRTSFGWGHKEIVTLASIVEKETGKKHERPRIASVFLNRLRLPGFNPKVLQTDPTIIYGCTVPLEKSDACKKFNGRIRTIHLRDRDNAWNTYTHSGLPPTPISNPGKAAIEAVFKPERSRYLYFVSRNDGTHYFSATKALHERAVDFYQRNRGPKPPPQP
ncbi:MAG: endolytic transglycosylase MltG [Myxococcales bacterium]|nr:endolytic transglycosylase MltG [Myxococcales bacterium]